MTGHRLLNQVKEKSEIVVANGAIFSIHISYHKIAGIEGYVAGLKFSDQYGSMDSAKKGTTNPFQLGIAIANKAVQMLKPDLHQISVLGFYLLTEDLESRRANGARSKRRIYHAQALEIHSELKHKLRYLTSFDVDGGLGWAMSANDFDSYEQFKVFETELAKQIRMSIC